MSIADTIRAFIVETVLFGDTSQDLSDTVSLIDTNIVDSTGVLELVGFVEQTWGIAVADAEIVPAHFETIGQLAAYVARKTSVAAVA